MHPEEAYESTKVLKGNEFIGEGKGENDAEVAPGGPGGNIEKKEKAC